MPGGNSAQGYDSVYNAKMAAIAERTSQMSEQAFESWNTGGGRALEEAQATEAIGLLPAQTAFEKANIGLGTQQLGYESKKTGYKSDLMNKFYDSIGKDNVSGAVSSARSDAAGAISEAKSTAARDAQRRGVAPSANAIGLQGAKLQVGAINAAREAAKDKQFAQYEQGLSI